MKHQLRYNSILKGICISLTLTFISCSQHDTKNKPSKKLDIDDSLISKLIGKWGGIRESTPVWDIRHDSIYYYDRSTAYPYKILNGDFIIDLPESKAVFEDISVVKDTMFFIDAQAHILIRAYRWPN